MMNSPQMWTSSQRMTPTSRVKIGRKQAAERATLSQRPEKMRCPCCLKFGPPLLVFFDSALHHTILSFSTCIIFSHAVFSSSFMLSQRMSFGPVCGPQKGFSGRPALAKKGAAETADSPTSILAPWSAAVLSELAMFGIYTCLPRCHLGDLLHRVLTVSVPEEGRTTGIADAAMYSTIPAMLTSTWSSAAYACSTCCTCQHIYIYTSGTYIHIYLRRQTYDIYVYTYIHVCVFTYIHVFICINIYMYIHTYTYMYMYSYLHNMPTARS